MVLISRFRVPAVRRVAKARPVLWCWRVLAVAALLSAPGTAIAQSSARGPNGVRASSSALLPGDFILVRIWREPDLSDTVDVDNQGIAVFPKLGPISVTGLEPDSLERLLVHEYSRYLQNPSIRVTVLRRITIWGAVAHPGPYPVGLTMTVTDALALAGGPSPDGKSNQVELRRGATRKVIDLSSDAASIGDLSLHSGDQLVVPRRSWISRNPGVLIGGIGTITSVLYLLAR
jgi:polysaccharide export outer membrane protein